MKVLEIKDIVRKDVPIYYKLFYTGTAVIELINKTVEQKIDFTLEMKPTGQKAVVVTVDGQLDYPVVPVVRELKQCIAALDKDGKLPPL